MAQIPFVRANGGGREAIDTNAAAGATPSIDLADGNVHDVTLTAAATFTFTGSVASYACSFTLILRQDGTGGWATTWPASVDWPGATAPTLSTGASDVSVLTFWTVDNGTTWFGTLVGDDFA